RGVGSGAEHQRAGAGGINPFRTIALDQSQNADAGAEPLLGMRPRAQDDIDQHGGVRTDGLGLMPDALVGPVAIAPVGGGHVLGFLELLEKRPPAHAPAAHRTVIELVEQRADRGIEFGQREEAPMPYRAKIQRPTTWTPTSTPRFREGRLLALSRGL